MKGITRLRMENFLLLMLTLLVAGWGNVFSRLSGFASEGLVMLPGLQDTR